jgi:TPR repeat protein
MKNDAGKKSLEEAAQKYIEAMQKWDDGEEKAAFDLFSQLADQGDAAAQNCLGIMYGTGQGVEKDNKKSLLHHKRAGRASKSSSDYWNIARQHDLMGNRRRALYWANKANAQNDKSASFELARLLLLKPRSNSRKRAVELLQNAVAGIAYVDISENDKEEAQELLSQLCKK